MAAVEYPVGTRVEIGFGSALAPDADALAWARRASRWRTGQSYGGKSSPHWYDPPNFHELLSASGDRPVRELIAHLDGCTGGTAGEIVTAAGLGRMVCREIDGEQATKLLERPAIMPGRSIQSARRGGAGCFC